MALLRLHQPHRLLGLDYLYHKPCPCRRFCLPVGLFVCIVIIVLNVATMHSLFTSSGALQAAALLSAAVRTTLAVDPVVELDYTSYRGTEMDDGVTRWMGMRFAAAPVDDLRFRAPIDPMQEDGPIDADAAKPYCLTTEGGPPSAEMQEDCLFLNVFAPSNATSDSKLPVFFFIQGGGYVDDSQAETEGSYAIVKTETPSPLPPC